MTVLWDLRDELRMCVDVACVRALEVCWFGFEGGLLGAAWVLEESGLYGKRQIKQCIEK